MNINIGKLASNSNSFLKKMKESDTNNNRLAKIRAGKDPTLNDYKETIQLTHKLSQNSSEELQFVKRFKDISQSLNEFEENLSQTQFLEQKADEIDNLIGNNNNRDIQEVIKNSTFNGKKVLSDFFNNDTDIRAELENLKKTINEQYSSLDNEYKKIQISNQNLMSLMSYQEDTSDIAKIDTLAISAENNLLNIDKKRVIDLIS